MNQKQIDIFKVISNPFYFEELNSRQGKRHQDINDLNKTSWPMNYALKSVTPTDESNKANLKFKNPQFDIILQAIRDYQQMDDDE